MEYRNSVRGRQNRTEGRVFENWIEASCRYYWEKGVASIEKTPEPMRPIKPYGERNRGQFVAVYEKQAQPDFKGVLCDGTTIIFDAKSTMCDTIMQKAVSEEQANTFDRYEKMGARCFILVSIAFNDFYKVPWSVWKNMKDLYKHKYMKQGKELEEFKVQHDGITILFLEGEELRDDC